MSILVNRRAKTDRLDAQGLPRFDVRRDRTEPAIERVARRQDPIARDTVAQIERDVSAFLGHHKGGMPVERLGEIHRDFVSAVRTGMSILTDHERRR